MNTPGRARKSPQDTKAYTVQIRLTDGEKRAFQRAADVAGIGLSSWMRERLRRASVRELEEVGEVAAFLLRGDDA
jgi:uncharacterized protein (DUF1778 family)